MSSMFAATSPKDYALLYAKLQVAFWTGADWQQKYLPIKNYLQNEKNPQSKRAKVAEQALWSGIASTKGLAGAMSRATFKFHNYDFISLSIKRCFIGKASPWEIQETLMLASFLGLLESDTAQNYCDNNLGVDCGGFVAAYWGLDCPHMSDPRPANATGYLPRTFWGARSRRRKSVSEVKRGDAAIFFDGSFKNGPDTLATRLSDGSYDLTTGTKAFHIGLVDSASFIADKFQTMDIADSSGSHSDLTGGNGVRHYALKLEGTGKSGEFVYVDKGGGERVYFVGPPGGAQPETAWKIPAAESIKSYLEWSSDP